MGFSSKRLLKPYSCDFSPCTKDSKDMFVSEFREKSPVDEFLIQKTENGGVPSVRLTSDIYRSEERRVGKECRSRWSPYH